MVVVADGRILGLVAMADTVKADAKAAVARDGRRPVGRGG